MGGTPAPRAVAAARGHLLPRTRPGTSKGEKEVLGEESQTVGIEEREVKITFNDDCSNTETGSFIEGKTETEKYCVEYETNGICCTVDVQCCVNECVG